MDLEVAAKLKEYKGLLDDDIITQEEFDNMKTLLLEKEADIEKASIPTPKPVRQAKTVVTAQTTPRDEATQTSVNPVQSTSRTAPSPVQDLTERVQQAREEGFLTNDDVASSTAGLSGSDRWQAATVDGFRNIFNFSGRTNKADYWWFVLSVIIIDIVTLVLLIIPIIGWLLFAIWSVVGGIAILSLSIRRLHDVGRPWPWILLTMTGFGTLLILIWALADGESVDNQWGAYTN
jgi:uncharacterized membrane protein YhaH (DUF805 family)